MNSKDLLYHSYEDLPLALSATEITMILNISRTKAYSLFHREDFPCIRIGRRVVVPRDLFFAWMKKQIANYGDYSDEITNSLLSSSEAESKQKCKG